MKLLILEDDAIDALAIRRELGDRYDITIASTLGEARTLLANGSLRPDVIITDLNLPDSSGPHTLELLKEAAPQTPVIVSSGHLDAGVRRQLDLLGAEHLHDKNQGFALLRAVLHHTTAFHQTIAAHKSEILAELDRVAKDAADDAVNRAVDKLIERLGLQDDEGLRMAIRLARGWDAAKSRFISAIATGLASAVLVALGAGLVAMLRNEATK